MGHAKGVTHRYHSKEFKLAVVQKTLLGRSSREVAEEAGIHDSLVRAWTRKYLAAGETSLEAKKRPGNPLAKYINRRELTEVEQLRYELAKAEIEIAKLKKVYEEERRYARQRK